jgi:sec-independent protein translocase protein TatB
VLDLSPVKILIVLIVGLVVLGPDKLPQLARQLGAAWGDFRRWRARIENDVRDSFPDLPSTQKITDAVRSPLSYLDRLADEHEQERDRERQRREAAGEGDDSESAASFPLDPAQPPPAPVAPPSPAVSARPDLRPAPAQGPLPPPPDDPSMN